MSLQMLKKRTVKVLALLGVLAFLGMAVMPMAISDAWGAALTWASGGSRDEIIENAVGSATGTLLWAMLAYGWTCTPVSLGAVAASVAFSA